MRSLLFVAVLIHWSSVGFGQLRFDKLQHDFGILESFSNRFTELNLTNSGSKKHYLLRIEMPLEVTSTFSNDLISPDSTIGIRLMVNPKKKGKFEYTVRIYTSDKDDATLIKLKGILHDFSPDLSASLQACPNFNQKPVGYFAKPFESQLIVLDSLTRKPILGSSILVIQNGRELNVKNSGKGYSFESQLGPVYTEVSFPGYRSASKTWFTAPDANQNFILLSNLTLEPEQEEIVEISPTETNNNTPIDTTKITIDNFPFTTEYFKTLNVVFVVDISGSMAVDGKLELMQFTLNSLIETIRDEDQLALVTYATDAYVLQKTTKGMNKTELFERVEALKVSGITAGGKGIKLGYKEAFKNRISGGKNLVIIITDGAFSKQTSADYLNYMEKYSKKGIDVSIIGIKPKAKDAEKMKLAADNGAGNYIEIKNIQDSKSELINLIRQLSFKDK